MRDIKFRCFEKELGMFYIDKSSDYTLEFGNNKAILNTFCSDGKMDSFVADNVMQYTGLKDKNGKDVFESDIVSDHVGIGVVEYSDKHAGFRVNYKNGQCKWFYDYILNGERESIEVIGNIYEDKHPLGANK